MEITKEQKEQFKAAIVLCLDTYASDKDIDEQMLASVMEVIKEIPEPEAVDPERTAVKYVGRRPEYSDGMFETGIWKKDQEKMIPVVTATKMLSHPSVYINGEGTGVIDRVEHSDNDDEKQEELHNIRNSIYEMTKGIAVRKYIADNFNGLAIDLPKNAPVQKVQEAAIQLIDQYGLPGM
jgi:hypothetical protein